MFLTVPRVDGDHRRLPIFSEAARVLPIDHRAARDNLHAFLFLQGDRQILPTDEILAHRMAPAHVAPFIAERIVLVKEVVLPFVIHHPIRVVHPVALRREMKAWTKWLGAYLR